MRIIGWSFPVLVRGDPRAGSPATLTIEWRPSNDIAPDEQKTRVDQLACVGTWWCRLIEAGGGGGDTIRPDECAASLSNPDPDRLPSRLTWSMDRLRVDPRALTMLFNLVLESRIEVTGLSLHCVGRDLEQDVTPRDQLPAWPTLPFPLRLERAERSVNVELEFGQDVPAQHRDPIEQALQVWAIVGGLGGFRDAVPIEQRSVLVPTDTIGFEFDLVVLSLRDFDVLPVAYDVLTNVAVKFAITLLPVRSLEIT